MKGRDGAGGIGLAASSIATVLTVSFVHAAGWLAISVGAAHERMSS